MFFHLLFTNKTNPNHGHKLTNNSTGTYDCLD